MPETEMVHADLGRPPSTQSTMESGTAIADPKLDESS